MRRRRIRPNGCLAAVVAIHPDRCADDDSIARHTQRIGPLSEKDKAPHCSKKHLRIIVHGNFPGRGIAVGFGNGKLSARAAQPRRQQAKNCQGAMAAPPSRNIGSVTTQENREK